MSVGPSNGDPCGAAQDYQYQVLTDFSGDGLAGPYSTYVSYDLTGLLYQGGEQATAAVQSLSAASCVTGYTATMDTISPPPMRE